MKVNAATGNLINFKMYAGEKPNGHSFNAVYQSTLNSNIYAAGEEFDNSPDWKAMFYKFNSNLDSLTIRYYSSGVGGDFFATNIVPTNDGGFAFPMASLAVLGQQQYWLIKTDTLGCDSTNGCTYPVAGMQEFKINNSEYTVYPNPANEVLNIENNSPNENVPLTIYITNTFGQIVLKEAVKAKT